MSILAAHGKTAGLTATGSESFTLGWRPKCVILFGGGNSSVGEEANSAFCIGWAVDDGTPTQTFHGTFGLHAADPMDTDKEQRTGDALRVHTTFNSAYWNLDVVFAATGFSITWTKTGSPTNSQIVGYLALGGDIQAAAGTLNSPTSVGTASVSGLSFQPSCGLFATGGQGTSSGVGTTAQIGIGMADAALTQGYVTNFETTASINSSTRKLYKSGKCIGINSASAISYEADLDSWDATGFTLDFTTVLASAQRVSYLVLGNCENELEHLTNPTSGSPPVAETLGPYGSTVLAQIFLGCSNTNDGTIQTASIGLEFGVTTKGAPGMHAWLWSEHSAAAANCAHGFDDDAAIRHTDMTTFAVDNLATATPQTDTSKETDLSWTSLDTGSAVRYMALSLGSKARATKAQCVSN